MLTACKIDDNIAFVVKPTICQENIVLCRKISRKRKKSKSRTQLYVVSENAASPYSSVNGPSPGGLHSFNGEISSAG